MFKAKFISGTIGILSSIFFLPEVEAMVKVALIVSVVLIALAFYLFLFWRKLQEIFLADAYEKFLLRLYKNPEYVEFLSKRQKRTSRKGHKVK
jgi:hypothetical protein